MLSNINTFTFNTFNKKKVIDDFSAVVSYEDIKAKNYSLSAGQYFEVKIEYVNITEEDFKNKLKVYDRENKSCYKCKYEGKIKKIYISGRSTFFCNNCQK